MDRNDMINLLRTVEQSGPVTTTQMSDLTLIVNTASLFGSLDYVQQLAMDVVLGNGYGNALYQGAALGNLAVGSSSDQLEKLVDKWFLGLDHPTATSAYQLATQPLFASGFAYTDIHQGGLGDCYLLAGLAEVALKHPEIISNMFIDNGDGTYTVRYFIDDQPYNPNYPAVATYITVDSMLPAGVADYSTELWVALAEKGYAQLKTLYGYGNGYGTIEGGFPVAAMNQFTGRAIVSSTLDLSLFTTDLSTGKMTCFGIGTHAYAVLNYDSASQVVTLYDPSGSVTTITWSQLVSDGAVLQCVL